MHFLKLITAAAMVFADKVGAVTYETPKDGGDGGGNNGANHKYVSEKRLKSIYWCTDRQNRLAYQELRFDGKKKAFGRKPSTANKGKCSESAIKKDDCIVEV